MRRLFYGTHMTTQKHTNTVFNGLLEAVQIVNTRAALGQNKTIKKLFKQVEAYLAARASAAMLTVKIKSVFFQKDTETLIIYTIRNGNEHYPIHCKRTGIANFAVVTTDNNKLVESHFKKWLSLKIKTDLPQWFAAQAAQKAAQNTVSETKNAPVIRRKKGGENPNFTYMKPGTDAHIARIDKQ